MPHIECISPTREAALHKPAIEQTEVYRPEDEVHASGLYRATHDPAHAGGHDVICIQGKIFPPCRVAIIPGLSSFALAVASKITSISRCG